MLTTDRDWIVAHARDNGWKTKLGPSEPFDSLPKRSILLERNSYLIHVEFLYCGDLVDAVIWEIAIPPAYHAPKVIAVHHPKWTDYPRNPVTKWIEYYGGNGPGAETRG